MVRSLSPRVVVLGMAAVSGLVFVGHEIAIRAAFRGTLESVGEIVDNSMPSVRSLASLRQGLNQLRTEAVQMAYDPTSHRAKRMSGALATVQTDLSSYRELPQFPGEAVGETELDRAVAAVKEAVGHLDSASSPGGARSAYLEEFVPAVDEADRIAESLVELNARHGTMATRHIGEIHGGALQLSLAFLLASVGIVTVVAFAADRSISAAQHETERRMDELDAFAARVAHDLRNPLGPMTLGLVILKREEHLSDRGRIAVERGESALKNALSLIEGLLAYARAGSRSDVNACASVRRAAREVVAELEPLADLEHAKIELDIPEEIEVSAPESVLKSIVGNLLRNGLLYLGEAVDRTVAIGARPEGDHIKIEITDRGQGMSRETLARIFQPFERGSAREGGHGLGLATVKRLVEAHRGRVEVRSVLGVGSTFVVRLPRARRHRRPLEVAAKT